MGSKDDVVVNLTVAGHGYRILGVAPSGLEFVFAFLPGVSPTVTKVALLRSAAVLCYP